MKSIGYYLVFVLFTLICFVPFSLLFLLTVLFDRERVVLHYASRFWSWGIYRICPWWHVQVEGTEKVGDVEAVGGRMVNLHGQRQHRPAAVAAPAKWHGTL